MKITLFKAVFIIALLSVFPLFTNTFPKKVTADVVFGTYTPTEDSEILVC